MPTERHDSLTPAEEILARVLTDAIVEDIFAGLSAEPWIAVRCIDESVQKELADRLRAEGREVILHSRTP
jgi:hypothetical protein